MFSAKSEQVRGCTSAQAGALCSVLRAMKKELLNSLIAAEHRAHCARRPRSPGRTSFRGAHLRRPRALMRAPLSRDASATSRELQEPVVRRHAALYAFAARGAATSRREHAGRPPSCAAARSRRDFELELKLELVRLCQSSCSGVDTVYGATRAGSRRDGASGSQRPKTVAPPANELTA